MSATDILKVVLTTAWSVIRSALGALLLAVRFPFGSQTSNNQGVTEMSKMKVVQRPVENALMGVWIGIGALLLLVVVMWIVNVTFGRIWVVPFALTGGLLIAMVGFRASFLLNFGVFGAFISLLEDKDKSQGVATGLIWLKHFVLAVSYAFMLSAFILVIIPFDHAPGAYWVIFLAVVLQQLIGRYYTDTYDSSKGRKIVTFLAVTASLWALWTTLGGAYTGKSFELETGEPLYMMDQSTGEIYYDIEPSDCRSWSLFRGHEGYDYFNEGTCFSPATGERLVPVTPDAAKQRNPSAWASILSDSDIGEDFEEETGIPLWLAIVVVVGVGVVLILWLGDDDKKKKSGSTDWSTNLSVLAVVAVVLGLVFYVFLVSADLLGWDDDLERIASAGSRPVACTSVDDAKRFTVPSTGRPLIVCENSKALYVQPLYRHGLDIALADSFVKEYGEYLKGSKQQQVTSFVKVYPPKTGPNRTTNRWMIVPQQSSNRGVSGYDAINVSYAQLSIRSIK